ncbi:MAG TPA: hypothetical protein VL974_08085 [Magnetospirillum sp.]|nr:hypothetical protein [Magnetospirillum sp.]
MVYRIICTLVFALFAASAFAQQEVPRHLQLARELLENVKPENNDYMHVNEVRFPSDLFSNGYRSNADCSGLVIELLDRAGTSVRSRMAMRSPKRNHPVSADFVASILQERGFQRIRMLDQAKPGDILAWEFTQGAHQMSADATGHTMMLDGVPKRIEPRPPEIAGTIQFEVPVIDSTEYPHDPIDTRIRKDGTKATGIGRGRIRLYADAHGSLVGYANNLTNSVFNAVTPEFEEQSQSKYAKRGGIGRPE